MSYLNFTAMITIVIAFFLGYLIAPWIYRNNIKVLISYPLWFTNKLSKFLTKKIRSYFIFPLILIFNSTSLFIILISCFIPFLPIIFVIWLGLNLGVSIFHISKGKHYFHLLINPVAILEILAAIITGSLSIQCSIGIVHNFLNISSNCFYINFIKKITFAVSIKIFIYVVIPILFLAAIIETIMIMVMSKKSGPKN